MRFAAVAILCAACSGGGQSPVTPPDAPTDADLGCGDCDAPNDAVDATIDAPTACTSLAYQSRPVESIALFEEGGRVHAGRSFRVEITYDSTPCELFAMPTWRVGTLANVVQIEAHVFAPRDLCPGLPMRRTRVITLRLEAGAWRLIGAGNPTPPQLMLTVGPAPLVPCAPSTAACRQDCDCPQGELCLGGIGLGGPFQECARPCELDRDCGGGTCASVPDGLLLTCDASMLECGNPGQTCPEGFTCATGVCAPDFVLSSSTRHECTCDEDCGAPLRCIQPSVPGRAARCEVACPTGGDWCQGAHVCGPASQDLSGLASSDSVCGWLGE